MPMEVLAEWSDKDPMKRLENVLIEERALPEGGSRRSATGSRRRSARPSSSAERDGYPDASEAHEGVFAADGWP